MDPIFLSRRQGTRTACASSNQQRIMPSQTDEELEEILDTEEAALRVFIKGVIQAQCRLIKYMGPQTARDEFENRVFHPASKDPVIQKHLGLEMAQSIFDQ
jgi:hypothetical protein